MTGWLILGALAVVVTAGLLVIGKLPRISYELVGAALLLGIAGYAWQGNPSMAGVSLTKAEDPEEYDETIAKKREEISGKFGGAQQWLVLSDALNRAGNNKDAANYMRRGVQEYPNNPDMWVGLGNKLVVHAEGIITPAAQFAFQRAAEISPEHPAPPFFFGLALAQSGRMEQAVTIWQELLDRSPKEAPWRADLETRLAVVKKTLPSAPPTVPSAE